MFMVVQLAARQSHMMVSRRSDSEHLYVEVVLRGLILDSAWELCPPYQSWQPRGSSGRTAGRLVELKR
jgi:hypothetical protein